MIFTTDLPKNWCDFMMLEAERFEYAADSTNCTLLQFVFTVLPELYVKPNFPTALRNHTRDFLQNTANMVIRLHQSEHRCNNVLTYNGADAERHLPMDVATINDSFNRTSAVEIVEMFKKLTISPKPHPELPPIGSFEEPPAMLIACEPDDGQIIIDNCPPVKK